MQKHLGMKKIDGKFGNKTYQALVKKFGRDDEGYPYIYSDKWNNDKPKYNSLWMGFQLTPDNKLVYKRRYYNDLPDAAYGTFNIHKVRRGVTQNGTSYYYAGDGDNRIMFVETPKLDAEKYITRNDNIIVDGQGDPIGFNLNNIPYIKQYI